MKRSLQILFAVLLPLLLSSPLLAEGKKSYAEFTRDSSLTVARGAMNLYAKGESFWLEIPDSLIGRKVLLSTTVTSSKSEVVPLGAELSANAVYTICREDSLIVLTAPSANVVIEGESRAISDALHLSAASVISYRLPMVCRSDSAASSIVKINDVMDLSKTHVASLKGFKSGDTSILSSEYSKKFSTIGGVEAFGSTVGYRAEASFKYKASLLFFAIESKYAIPVDLFVSLTLLGESTYRPRLADGRVGTGKISHTIYSEKEGTKVKDWACRWNVRPGGNITVYLDTLLPAHCAQAVTEGILAWNEGFRKAGLGEVLQVQPLSSEVRIEDPHTTVVTAGCLEATSFTATTTTDATSGEILSAAISIPGDYKYSVRRYGMIYMSEVDDRFATYEISDEAAAEVLRAQVMGLWGRVLGLSSNKAASWAWSPEQLRDPAFTALNGFCASVTDDVLFNFFARPGDREKGACLIQNRIGPYDRFAMEWLYNPSEDKSALDAVLGQAYGKAELQFAGTENKQDPRVISNGLGNDVCAWMDAVKGRCEYAYTHSHNWLKGNVPSSFKTLFSEWIYLENYYAIYYAGNTLGSIMSYDTRNGYPVAMVLDEEQLRAIARKALDMAFDTKVIDGNRQLLWTTGPYRDLAGLTRRQITGTTSVKASMRNLDLANRYGLSAYTPAEYLRSYSDYMLALLSSDDGYSEYNLLAMDNYIQNLYSQSPTALKKRNTVRGGLMALAPEEVEFRVTVPAADAAVEQDLSALGIAEMDYLHRRLAKLRKRAKGDKSQQLQYFVELTDINKQ